MKRESNENKKSQLKAANSKKFSAKLSMIYFFSVESCKVCYAHSNTHANTQTLVCLFILNLTIYISIFGFGESNKQLV